ncbi:MAG: universal stress protein [Gammaproteobacteria bacterium]|nr:universal stress protein [Gammaproteobacteria bacterium]
MYQDFVLPLTGTAGDDDAMAAALALARHFQARLTVLELVNLPMPTANPWGLMPDIAMGEAYSRLRAQGEANAGRLRTRLADSGADCEVRVVEALFSDPPRQAARSSHHADLLVVAGPSNDGAEGSIAQGFAAALLLESGRPVLVVPPGAPLRGADAGVLLAWRQGAEAARALHDSLPLLRAASRGDLVAVDLPAGDEARSVLDEVATHLARHGVHARVEVVESRGRAVAAVLTEHALDMAAGLIVAGGYGHSLLCEWVIGGVTRELLLGSPVPVLFSH